MSQGETSMCGRRKGEALERQAVRVWKVGRCGGWKEGLDSHGFEGAEMEPEFREPYSVVQT